MWSALDEGPMSARVLVPRRPAGVLAVRVVSVGRLSGGVPVPQSSGILSRCTSETFPLGHSRLLAVWNLAVTAPGVLSVLLTLSAGLPGVLAIGIVCR